MRYLFLIFLAVLAAPLHADEEERQAIIERIKPLGLIHVKGGSKKLEKTKEVAVEKKVPGQGTYEQYCIVCHKDGVAGAPKFQTEADWKPRLTAAGSIDGLVAIAVKGLNVMPPKGTCQDCSDKDLKEAIEYMLPHHE